MKIEEISTKMIEFSNGNLHDINHFLKVLQIASMIGKLENLTKDEQEVLEISAIVHDIACPLCRKKYGNTNGKLQEKEGGILVKNFLKQFDIEKDIVDKVTFLVEHHHSFSNIDKIEWQILVEADFIVNADEENMNKQAIVKMKEKVFKTKSGIHLLELMYL